MADVTEEDLADFFKEFNVTNFDLNKDPELVKWAPSKEFFERYGFQNNAERYKRKTQDVKMDFYKTYTKPILPQYKTFISDLLTLTHFQTVDARYEYDALHAFGLCTQYYTVMKGYPMQEEIDILFNAMMNAIGLDPVKIRDDAKRILTLVKSLNKTEEEVLQMKDCCELAIIFENVRKNRFFKFTDAWGVGLGRVMELLNIEVNEEAFARWALSLKWVFTPRLTQTWNEFTSDQLKMQGVESMQKALMIREKKRAAARLEKKAADFEDKKKALMELNQAIDERRSFLISEQKMLKKRYEPEEYERIVAAEEQQVKA